MISLEIPQDYGYINYDAAQGQLEDSLAKKDASGIADALITLSDIEEPFFLKNYLQKYFIGELFDDVAQEMVRQTYDTEYPIMHVVIPQDAHKLFYSLTDNTWERLFASQVLKKVELDALSEDVLHNDKALESYMPRLGLLGEKKDALVTKIKALIGIAPVMLYDFRHAPALPQHEFLQQFVNPYVESNVHDTFMNPIWKSEEMKPDIKEVLNFGSTLTSLLLMNDKHPVFVAAPAWLFNLYMSGRSLYDNAWEETPSRLCGNNWFNL